jgi:hypothetical protein
MRALKQMNGFRNLDLDVNELGELHDENSIDSVRSQSTPKSQSMLHVSGAERHSKVTYL